MSEVLCDKKKVDIGWNSGFIFHGISGILETFVLE